MVENTNNQKKKMNPFLWFLFAIVIPVIILIALAVIVLGVAGFNVIDWAKEKGNDIPVVSEMVTTDEESSVEQEEQQVQAAMDDKNQEIEVLNQTIRDLEANVDQLEQENVKLENKQETTTEEAAEEDTAEQGIEIVVGPYEEMKSDRAAQIIQNLDSDMAVRILKEISTEARGEILEAMEPESAAEFTQLLISDGE
ncbi:MotE family protein [Oceanobacillus massiliensis]|uniref:MotE family protein n=1 Tax=Oceanobacillus massiliensis TaxID=1465765 RepID=UPI0030169996